MFSTNIQVQLIIIYSCWYVALWERSERRFGFTFRLGFHDNITKLCRVEVEISNSHFSQGRHAQNSLVSMSTRAGWATATSHLQDSPHGDSWTPSSPRPRSGTRSSRACWQTHWPSWWPPWSLAHPSPLPWLFPRTPSQRSLAQAPGTWWSSPGAPPTRLEHTLRGENRLWCSTAAPAGITPCPTTATAPTVLGFKPHTESWDLAPCVQTGQGLPHTEAGGWWHTNKSKKKVHLNGPHYGTDILG